jgi:radical SAM protein with 4Fe4S-binding SPASM domain
VGAPGPYLRFLAGAADREVPLDVMVELTHRCNFRCRHCYIPDFTVPDALSTERLLRLLDELAEIGTLRLALSGGEPLLRPDWLVVARRARALGFELRVLTNASPVTAAVADALAALYATVEVSVHSLDPREFDATTASPGSFARVMAAIEALRSRGVALLIKTPVTTLNAASAGDVAAWAAGLGIECRTDPAITHRKNGDLAPVALRVAPEHLLPYYSGPGAAAAARAASAEPHDPDERLCAAGARYANVTASGDVLACNSLPVVAGNVVATPFREIWETSSWLLSLRALRRRDLPACTACGKLAYCGRCPAQALVEDGDLLGPAAWACANAAAIEAARELREPPER